MEIEKKTLVLSILVSALVITNVLTGLSYLSTKENLNRVKRKVENLESRVKKPEVWSALGSWWENVNNTKKATFTVSIFNAGDIEAKNVTVGCGAYRQDKEEYLFAGKKNIGNIASHTTTHEYITISKEKNINASYGSCSLLSCSNCENLDRKISSLEKIVKGIAEKV